MRDRSRRLVGRFDFLRAADDTHELTRTPQGWKIHGMRYDKVYARGNEKAHDYIPEK